VVLGRIGKLYGYENAVPDHECPIVETCSCLGKMLKAVTEHSFIGAVRFIIRQISEEFKLLGKVKFVAWRIERPPPLPNLRENLVPVVEVQASNILTKNAFSALRVESFFHLAVWQNQSTWPTLELGHYLGNKLSIFASPEIVPNVLVDFVADIGSDRKRLKGIYGNTLIQFIRFVHAR
jgi:hypothetical protein